MEYLIYKFIDLVTVTVFLLVLVRMLCVTSIVYITHASIKRYFISEATLGRPEKYYHSVVYVSSYF